LACWSANSCERLPSREGRRGSRRRRPEPERRSRRTPLGSPWSSSHHRGNRRCGSRCAPGRSPIPWTLDAPFWLLARPWLRRANLTRWDSRTTDRLLGRLLRGPFVGVPAGWSSVYADCEETEAGTQQADRPSPRTRDRWSTPSGCHGRIIAQVGHADGASSYGLPCEGTAWSRVCSAVWVAAATSWVQRWQAAAWLLSKGTAANTHQAWMSAPHNEAGRGSPTKARATAWRTPTG